MAWLLLIGFLGSQGGLAVLIEAGLSWGAQVQHLSAHGVSDGCDESKESGCQERCPGDSSDGTCPIECHDCACCSGRGPAVMPMSCAPGLIIQASDVQPFVPEYSIIETYQRVFRPPRPELVC